MNDLIRHKNDLYRVNILRRLNDLISDEIGKVANESDFKLGSGFKLASYLEDYEKNIIRFALNIANYNQIVAARLLGIKHTTLNFKVKKYKLLEPADKQNVVERFLHSRDEAA